MDKLFNPFVSVIIPVFNDATRLKLCLESLENQSYPEHLYEVIVVDNASEKMQDISAIVAQYSYAVYAYESQPGSYAARNQGISLAKGEIVAFTDADCIPTANWLEKGVSRLLSIPNCGLVAGKVEIFFQNPEQPTAVELYESITAFPQEQLLEKYRGGATANIFTLKDVIDVVGSFDADLKSHGDLEWGQRVFESGYQQTYADDVKVAHPARVSLKQLYNRTLRLTAGNYNLQLKKASSNSKRQQVFMINLINNLLPPVNFVWSAFQDSRLPGILPKIRVSLVMFMVRYISAMEIIKLQLGGGSAR